MKPGRSKAFSTPCALLAARRSLPYSKQGTPSAWEREQGAQVTRRSLAGAAPVAVRVRGAQLLCFIEGHAGGHVAVQQIVGGGLVGDAIGTLAGRGEVLAHIRRVRPQREGPRFALRGGGTAAAPCLVEVVEGFIDVPASRRPRDARGIDLRNQGHPPFMVIAGGRGRAHSAQSSAQHHPPGERAAEVARCAAPNTSKVPCMMPWLPM